MNLDVKQHLIQHFDLDFSSSVVVAEADALCKHCRNATMRGRFSIPFDATLETAAVRRCLSHARRCAAVQRLIVKGESKSFGGRTSATRRIRDQTS